jgi:hypothetical protein
MTRFEDNLWREVEGKYGPELSEAAGPLHPRSRLRVPMIAGTSLGVVGGSAAAVIVLTAASSSPAFAVTPHRDGTVSVVIRRIEGIPGANHRLAQLGIHARAVQVAGGCQVPAVRALARVTVMTWTRDGHKNWVNVSPGTIHASIRPAQIPSGRTLVIPAIRAGKRVRLVRGRAVRGVVPACLPAAIGVQTSSTSSGVTVVACRDAIPPGLHPRVVVPGPATNTTSTNPAPSQATITQTTASPATTTDSGTQTNATTATDSGPATNSGTTTNSGTATDSGTTTGSGTTPSWTPVGPANHALPPALLRACRLAAGAAAR